jgi:hypothetical protein
MEFKTPLPRYQCHKIVQAAKIAKVTPYDDGSLSIVFSDERFMPRTIPPDFVPKNEPARPQPGWYYVVYEDGYQSFSPAKPFEDGYTLIP